MNKSGYYCRGGRGWEIGGRLIFLSAEGKEANGEWIFRKRGQWILNRLWERNIWVVSKEKHEVCTIFYRKLKNWETKEYFMFFNLCYSDWKKHLFLLQNKTQITDYSINARPTQCRKYTTARFLVKEAVREIKNTTNQRESNEV